MFKWCVTFFTISNKKRVSNFMSKIISSVRHDLTINQTEVYDGTKFLKIVEKPLKIFVILDLSIRVYS